jgi:tight adherence protein C
MLLIIALLTALAVVSLTMLLLQSNANSATMAQLDDIASIGAASGEDTLARRRRQQRLDRMKSVLQAFGERVESGRKDSSEIRQFLLQAGYVDPNAVSIYWATRVILATGFVAGSIFLLPLLNVTSMQLLMAIVWLGGLGWVGPVFYVRSRLKGRQKELQKAMPDMLDMLVVCVEAGLGLNQALVRVADEIDHVSLVMSEQLALVNLEMRAGTPRDEALKNLDRPDRHEVAGGHADPDRPVRHLGGRRAPGPLGHDADQAAPAGRGSGGQDHDQAGVPAGAVRVPGDVRGGAGAVGHRDLPDVHAPLTRG